MLRHKLRPLNALALAFPLAATAGLISACDQAKDKLEECLDVELSCPDKGVAQGNASISGLVEIDAFFAAVITVSDAAGSLEASMKAELRALALALGGEVKADASVEELAAEVKASFDANVKANLEGELALTYEPAKCEVDVEVVAKASAACDAEVDPGSVKVECSGSCEIEASATAECEAQGSVVCEGKAPNLECSGTCSGACQIEGSAECSGNCEGSCDGECSACLGGECTETDGKITNCVGSCSGKCEGTCRVEGGAECNGKCEGTCRYEPGEAKCEADAKVSCQAKADGHIECQGKCEGEVNPPKVKAECEASVEAKASAELRCTPPRVDLRYRFKADLSADAQAELRVRFEAIKVRYSAILALNARLKAIGTASGSLAASAGSAVKKSIEATQDAAAEGDLQILNSVKCATGELGSSTDLLKDASGKIEASVSAFVTVQGAIGDD